MEDAAIIEMFPRLTQKEAENVYQKTLKIDFSKPLSEEDRFILEKYEGRGNQYSAGKIDEGLVHQFYTPYILTKKMWDLAQHYGFDGGKVCEPSFGTGRFFKFAPKNCELFGFDLDETNFKIASALYPNAKLYHQEFETAFLQPPTYSFKYSVNKTSGGFRNISWLPPMDIVIGNPPYGQYEGYYKTYMPKDFNRFEFLFIRKGLELLKHGGLLIYIVSQNVMNNGGKYEKMKKSILDEGEFVDAVRLPVGIFTSTQIGTDIVIFRKK